MSGVNKVILVGNVGQDPEIRSMQDGREVANFSLATSQVWNDKATGERRERTEWHKVVVFVDGLVSVVKRFVRGGSKLYVEGSLQNRKWTDAQGVEHKTVEVVLQGYSASITLLDSRSEQGAASAPRASSMPAATPSFVHDHAPVDDEIPF